MNVTLPMLREDKKLETPYFPAGFQTVIFRNWGLVPPERIAKVIGTNVDTVRECAIMLGLPGEPAVSNDWLTKGYITIIRYNWHILSCEDICILLGWTKERLAYSLKEDDFLLTKLGYFKPSVQDYQYRSLNEKEKSRTLEICSMVKNALSKIPKNIIQPFDFVSHFRLYAEEPRVISDPRYEERYIYSYCALYGDTLLDRKLLDESFPDELLEAYASLGITGVWIQIVLYTLVPFPFDEHLSEGWEERQKGMKYLTEKLNKYGLRLFLYFNEPRSMPNAFFEQYPNLKGMEEGNFSTLCVSVPEVQDYLRDSVSMLVQNVPLLGGFFTITASENLTNCHSHLLHGAKTTCPRCAHMSYADSFALVNRLVWEGVSRVSDTARVIAWNWAWNPKDTPEVIRQLPKEVAVMNVSEQGISKLIGDTPTSVYDYSISVEGPGEYALETWKYAHQKGHKTYAKLQMNNSWEMAAVPYLPVFEKIYRHMCKLVEAKEAGPDALMLSWTQGGYPSLILRFISEFYEKQEQVPSLEDIYHRLFKKEQVPILAQAFHLFSEAFDKFPFYVTTAYRGPQEHAPANILYEKPSGFDATMTGFPYDDLEWWRSRFPRDTYMKQLRLMSEQWHSGAKILRALCENSEDPILRELWDCVEACDCHFRSMYLQCQFICLRDGYVTEDSLSIREVLEEEKTISLRTAIVQTRNATIGYESANHYFYYQNALLEKMINCEYLMDKMQEVETTCS